MANRINLKKGKAWRVLKKLKELVTKEQFANKRESIFLKLYVSMALLQK